MTDLSPLFMQVDDQVQVRSFTFERVTLRFLAEDIEDESDEEICERWQHTCGKLLEPSSLQEMAYGDFAALTGTLDLPA